jgi:hypothetical protein
VNWNSGDLLRRCMASMRANATAVPREVVVVDNGSTDGSPACCEGLQDVTVIRAGRNLGFGAACNVGARAARAAIVLFLNPDCEVAAGSLERCVTELQAPGVGVVGIALVDESGAVARSCHRFPTFVSFVWRILGLNVLSHRFNDGSMASWDHRSDADVDHVIGAFYAMRRELFERLGGFDERFFVYLEDLDLSLRVRQAGHRVRFLASPPSFHAGGGTSRNIKARRLFYATRSRILYAYKHFPRCQGHAHLALTLLVEPLTRSVLALARRSGSTLAETFAAFAMVWQDLPMTLRIARRP